LAFEDEVGTTHEVTPLTIRELVESLGQAPKVVVVSACYSASAAASFAEAGLSHVVAIRADAAVLDISAARFSRVFYRDLFMGQPVERAFIAARAAVRTMPRLDDPDDESKKFVLLPAESDHSKIVFESAESGAVSDATRPPPSSNLSAPEVFIGRNILIQEAIQRIRDRRLVTLRGAPGIGKTSLACAIGQYLNERNNFADGVYFVPLRAAQSDEALRFSISQSLELTALEGTEFLREIGDRESLLILDNMETLLTACGNDARRTLAELTQACPRLRFITTSREQIGGGIPGLAEAVVSVRRLSDQDALTLFAAHTPEGLSLQQEELPALEDVLQYLSGHPQAIVLAAPLLHDRSITELAELLANQRVDALEVEGVAPEDQDSVTSLVISLRASLDRLRSRSLDATRLFTVLGLMPSGASPADLDSVWGPNWREPMSELTRMNLVERSEPPAIRYSMFPFVCDFAVKLISPEDAEQYHAATLRLASRQLTSMLAGRYSEPAEVQTALLEVEDNIWACLRAEIGGAK
jgi:hypothetical protein